MSPKPLARGNQRDRHDRGIRRPLLSKLFKHGQSRNHSFEQYVSNAMDYLKGLWPEELEGVRWKILDAPAISGYSQQVPRYRVDKDQKLIIIFRIPTERFGSHKRAGALDERIKVEHQVFEAVAEMIDVDPWDLVPDYFRR